MGYFRKKPVVIQAERCAALVHFATHEWHRLPNWFVAAYDAGGVVIAHDGINLPTLEGTMRAELTDYVICGVKGELYPCKPDIFSATYEPVET